MGEAFRKFAHKASHAVGTAWAFLAAVTLIVVWAISGPFLHFSDPWQLTINTSTTIITFLMVFLIQNAQNRDSQALHLKLDELLRSQEKARTGLINLEELSDKEIKRFQEEFIQLRETADDIVELTEETEADRHERREQASHAESTPRAR